MMFDLCWHVSPQIRRETSNGLASTALKCLHGTSEDDFSLPSAVHFHYLHTKKRLRDT